MRTPVKLRTLTAEEVIEIKRLASSRKEPIRLVQRARILAFMREDANLYASEAGIKAGFSSTVTGPVWVRRFNEKGLDGLEGRPRQGRKPTHGAEVHSQLVSLATQKPKTLGYPFELWTLERLQSAFKERHGVPLSDSTIWEWLAAEGLEWKRQRSWFHEAQKHDPEFVKKKRSIVAAYIMRVPHTRVICVDEMRPLAVKTYPGEEWSLGRFSGRLILSSALGKNLSG